jgi:hypothetical protein
MKATLTVRKAKNGELVLDLPDDLLLAGGMKTGDRLRWRMVAEGEWLIERIDADTVLGKDEYEGWIVPSDA